MTEAERAQLELDRRKENKVRKARGEDRLGTFDWEMKDKSGPELREIAKSTSSD